MKFDNSSCSNSRESTILRDDRSQINLCETLKLVFPGLSVCTWNLLELCSCIASVTESSFLDISISISVFLRFRLLTNARNEMRCRLQQTLRLRHSIKLRLGAAIKVDLETAASQVSKNRNRSNNNNNNNHNKL